MGKQWYQQYIVNKKRYAEQYYQEHKETILVRLKRCHQRRKEEFLAHWQECHDKSKALTNETPSVEKQPVKHDCTICGRSYTLKNKLRHEKSNKHQNTITNTTTC